MKRSSTHSAVGLLLALLSTLAMTVFGQTPAVTNSAAIPTVSVTDDAGPLGLRLNGGPGTYNLIAEPQAQVPITYTITGVRPEDRYNLIETFKGWLQNDGEKGGQISLGATSDANGKAAIDVTIVATDKFHTGFARVVQTINLRQSFAFGSYSKTFTYSPQYRSAEALVTLAKEFIPPTTIVYADIPGNQVIVDTDPTFQDYYIELFKKLDVPARKMRVQVEVIWIRKADAANIGPKWDAWKTLLGPIGVNMVLGRNPAGNMKVNSIEAAFSLSPDAACQFLNYMAGLGNARFESRTVMFLKNGLTTVFSTQTEVPYGILTESGGKLVQEKATQGQRLEIKPTFGDIGSLLDVSAYTDSIVGKSESGAPIVTKTEVHSQLCIPTNSATDQKFLISGLEETADEKHVSGIPLLMDIPLAGRLFSQHSISQTKYRVYYILSTSDGKVDTTN